MKNDTKQKLKWIYQIPMIGIQGIWCNGCRNDFLAFFINRLWEYPNLKTLKKRWEEKKK